MTQLNLTLDSVQKKEKKNLTLDTTKLKVRQVTLDSTHAFPTYLTISEIIMMITNKILRFL